MPRELEVGDRVKDRNGWYGNVSVRALLYSYNWVVFDDGHSALVDTDALTKLPKDLTGMWVGDIVEVEEGKCRLVVMAVQNRCYLLRGLGEERASYWYTPEYLIKSSYGYKFVPPRSEGITIKINGKQYDQNEVTARIKELKPVGEEGDNTNRPKW